METTLLHLMLLYASQFNIMLLWLLMMLNTSWWKNLWGTKKVYLEWKGNSFVIIQRTNNFDICGAFQKIYMFYGLWIKNFWNNLSKRKPQWTVRNVFEWTYNEYTIIKYKRFLKRDLMTPCGMKNIFKWTSCGVHHGEDTHAALLKSQNPHQCSPRRQQWWQKWWSSWHPHVSPRLCSQLPALALQSPSSW